jgi:hypothetical protein
MIVEAILSTVDSDGVAHFAPMGILWGDRIVEILPYRGSRTFENLTARRGAVVNVTDDVRLFVSCALEASSRRDRLHRPAKNVPGGVLDEVCSYRELEIVRAVDEGQRRRFLCSVVASGRDREFLGFNRAAAAILEATIAATRRSWLPPESLLPLLDQARLLTEKTGGRREIEALRHLLDLCEEGSS